MSRATVKLWGRTIGTVFWDAKRGYAQFEYAPDFVADGVEIAPLQMPLSARPYAFPEISHETFRGLPGLLADALPDRFGTVLTDAWLAVRGRTPDDLNPVDRLCFTGSRGMGALEFAPADGPAAETAERLDLDGLVRLTSEILINRKQLVSAFGDGPAPDPMPQILRIGTSAGGSRAKAVVAWNGRDDDLRGGQGPIAPGLDPWLLKFDGVVGNKDREQQADVIGYGKVEYAYHKMAAAAGIEMADCRLLRNNDHHHFITRRFDRASDGGKRHMQTLTALAHFSIDRPGNHSYEQLFDVCRKLRLTRAELEQQSRRLAFNILARNHDDHAKNTSFLMSPSGAWSLSPAYDLTFSYNPIGHWTQMHQTSMAGKRDGFTFDDYATCVETAGIERDRAAEIMSETCQAVAQWPIYADGAGVEPDMADHIARTHRLYLRP